MLKVETIQIRWAQQRFPSHMRRWQQPTVSLSYLTTRRSVEVSTYFNYKFSTHQDVTYFFQSALIAFHAFHVCQARRYRQALFFLGYMLFCCNIIPCFLSAGCRVTRINLSRLTGHTILHPLNHPRWACTKVSLFSTSLERTREQNFYLFKYNCDFSVLLQTTTMRSSRVDGQRSNEFFLTQCLLYI